MTIENQSCTHCPFKLDFSECGTEGLLTHFNALLRSQYLTVQRWAGSRIVTQTCCHSIFTAQASIRPRASHGWKKKIKNARLTPSIHHAPCILPTGAWWQQEGILPLRSGKGKPGLHLLRACVWRRAPGWITREPYCSRNREGVREAKVPMICTHAAHDFWPHVAALALHLFCCFFLCVLWGQSYVKT